MAQSLTISKSELAQKCGVSVDKVAEWCNVDYFAELSALGYTKCQKIFTPLQYQFLRSVLLEYDQKNG